MRTARRQLGTTPKATENEARAMALFGPHPSPSTPLHLHLLLPYLLCIPHLLNSTDRSLLASPDTLGILAVTPAIAKVIMAVLLTANRKVFALPNPSPHA